MISITNKLESIEAIKKRNLNRFPEELFQKGETLKIKKFLEKYPAEYYAIRDKAHIGGVFKLKVKQEDVLKEIEDYELFTINVSSFNYAQNQLLVGEIVIKTNCEVYIMSATLPALSIRDASKNPTFNLNTNIFDKKLNKIPDFDFIYNYIVENHLENMVVEFALFDKGVGIKNERIIIYELRTHY